MVSKIDRYRAAKATCIRKAELFVAMPEAARTWLQLAESYQILIEAEERDPTLLDEPAAQVHSPHVALEAS